MGPNLLIRIQLWTVGRKKKQRQHALLVLHKFPDFGRTMRWVSIDNQVNRLARANQKTLEKFDEDIGSDRTLIEHELELSPPG